MKKFLTLLACLAISCFVFSQDKIDKKNGEIIKAKVVEIGTDEIKYKLFDNPDGPVYATERGDVIKIVYSDGRVELYKSNFKDPELYRAQLKNNLKLSFLSPLFGHLMFSFEHSIQPGRSWEANISFIGLGKNYPMDYYGDPSVPPGATRDARGVALGFGYKFLRLPDFSTKGMRFTHILQGSYIKPTIYAGAYSENGYGGTTGQEPIKRYTVAFAALMAELGKQWIFSDKVTLDIYLGLGYVADNADNYYYPGNGYNNVVQNFVLERVGSSPGFAVNGGIKIGILLK